MGNVSRPSIQVYTMQSVAEAQAVAALGVDHVGVTPATQGLPGEISVPAAAEICRAVSGLAKSVALSVDTDAGGIIAMAEMVKPQILHLCGPPGVLEPDVVAAIGTRLGDTAIMQAIAVTDESAVALAHAYAPVVDYLILDSMDPAVTGIGAAGVVHDWSISARIVREVAVPVVLAGGLGPDNVAAAIAAVRPWGVDSLSRTNRHPPNGGFVKDLERVRAFVTAAVGGEP